MQLSHKAITEFKEIYEEEFGKKISSSKADVLGMKLLNLMRAIYRPISTNSIVDSTARSGKLARDEWRPTEATDTPIINS